MSDRIWIFCLALCIVTQTNLYSQLLIAEGDIDLKDHQVINLADPVNTLDAATKAYADQVVTSFAISVLGTDVQTLLDAGLGPLELMTAGIEKDSLYGKFYQGGLIFYLDDQDTIPGIQGMVAAPMDQSNTATWGCPDKFVDGADETGIGTGSQNTMDIVNGCVTGCFACLDNLTSGIAAVICSNLNLNGYNDWFLPSKDELNEMYQQIGQGAMGTNQNSGGFTGNTYWSSSEDLEYYTLARNQTFSHGGVGSSSKSLEYSVRAVRAF